MSDVKTASAASAGPYPGAPDVGRVAAGSYKVEPDHTQVLFTLNHLGFTLYTGQFIQPSGSLTIDPAKPDKAVVDVAFAIAQVSTTSTHFTEVLQSADFFDTATFPQARFTSTKVVADGTSATISGDLTMRGVTKPVTLQARLIGAGVNPRPPNKSTIGFAATAVISRSDFGLGFGVPVISDRVDLVINAAFEAE